MPIQIADAYTNSAFAQRQTGLLFNLPVPDPEIEQLPEGVSLCMIVKNEERFLAECLESAKDCVDEICIVDTGSTDRTVEIARAYGAKIEFREWRNDFSWARNESLKMATKRWTLVLDGDEELTRDSIPLLKALGKTPAGLAAVYINIVNIVDDPMGLGTMSHRLVRVFPTNPQMRYQNVIHESLVFTGGELLSLLSPITILHKGYTGEMLSSREKDARNKPLLRKAYEENGDDPFAMFNFGNVAISSGDYDLGIEVLSKMLATSTEPKMYWPLAYIMLSQAYLEGTHDYDKALETIEAGLKLFPNDAGLVFMRGQVLFKMNRLEDARVAYEQTIGMRDQMRTSVMTDEEIFEWKVYYAMSGTYEKEGDREKALEWIEKAVVNKPNSPALQRLRGQMQEALGLHFDAEQSFRKYAELDPATGRVEFVNYLLRRKRFAQAIALVDAGGTEHNDSTFVQLNVLAAEAMMENASGDPVPYLEAALRRAPGSGTALTLYEQVLTARNQPERLARLHAEELEAPLLVPDDYVRRVFRLLALQRSTEAWETAERGLERFPDNPKLHFNGALALLRLGREAEAAEHLARVEDRAPEVFTDAMQMRAVLLARSGDFAGAATAIRAWVHALGNESNAIVTGAQWLRDNGGRDQARALLADFADQDRRIATELASLLMGDGDFTAAGAVAERALR